MIKIQEALKYNDFNSYMQKEFSSFFNSNTINKLSTIIKTLVDKTDYNISDIFDVCDWISEIFEDRNEIVEICEKYLNSADLDFIDDCFNIASITNKNDYAGGGYEFYESIKDAMLVYFTLKHYDKLLKLFNGRNYNDIYKEISKSFNYEICDKVKRILNIL